MMVTSTQMSVDTHVACSAGQTFAFAVRNMLLGLRIAVKFGHAKIDDKDLVCHLGTRLSDQKVIWLDISIN